MGFHPGVLIFFSIIVLSFLMIYSHPVIILGIVLMLFYLNLQLKTLKELKNKLKFAFFTMLLIVLINPLVSSAGQTIIVRINHVPLIHQFKITLESLLYGMNMAVRFLGMTLVFILHGSLSTPDETFTFFSKYFNRLTLTIAMTVNIVHRLRIEMIRIKEVMVTRGVDFKAKKYSDRLKALYGLLKVILISALEGAINRAEALEARQYNRGHRNYYKKNRWTKKSIRLLIVSFLLVLLLSVGIFYQYGTFSFYPRVSRVSFDALLYTCFISGTLFLSSWLMKGDFYETDKI